MKTKKNDKNDLVAAAERAVSDLQTARAAAHAIYATRPERLDTPNCSMSSPIVAKKPDGTTVSGLTAKALLASYDVASTEASDEVHYRTDVAMFALDAAEIEQGDENACACNLVILHRDLTAIHEQRERLTLQRQREPESIARSRLAIAISELDVREQERVDLARSAHTKKSAERKERNLPAPPSIPAERVTWSGRQSVRQLLDSNPPASQPEARSKYISPALATMRPKERGILLAVEEECRKAEERARAEAAYVPAAERQRQAADRDVAEREAKAKAERAEEEARVEAGRARIADGEVPTEWTQL